jgi:hypothetical protein
MWGSGWLGGDGGAETSTQGKGVGGWGCGGVGGWRDGGAETPTQRTSTDAAEGIVTHTHTHTHMCVCVCVCVYTYIQRERDSQKTHRYIHTERERYANHGSNDLHRRHTHAYRGSEGHTTAYKQREGETATHTCMQTERVGERYQ